MSVSQPERVVQCIHYTHGLVTGETYVVRASGFDPLTKQSMVKLIGGGQFWAWRFHPGPPVPPKSSFRFGV